MGIFSRGRRTDDSEASDSSEASEASDVSEQVVDDLDATEDLDADDDGPAEERFSRARGPFDAAEVDDDEERIDLGSLRVAPVDGLQLRLELDQEQQNVVSAHAVLAGSTVQLEAYAAPRTSGVWPEIRGEIADSVAAQGGSAEIVDGPLGRELVATIPSRGADGRTVRNTVRFLGVDGPRWFLRAVISGPAASDDSSAEPLVDLVRNVVVVRDDQARPPRESLPLRVPSAAGEEQGEEQGEDPPENDDEGAGGRPRRSADDLAPFQRGPEITEVR